MSRRQRLMDHRRNYILRLAAMYSVPLCPMIPSARKELLPICKGENMLRTILALVLVTSFIAGCDTMAGFGRDVGRLGGKIEHKAERNK
jgi:predicted small secreted protein